MLKVAHSLIIKVKQALRQKTSHCKRLQPIVNFFKKIN
jgi:hypothetical protein